MLFNDSPTPSKNGKFNQPAAIFPSLPFHYIFPFSRAGFRCILSQFSLCSVNCFLFLPQTFFVFDGSALKSSPFSFSPYGSSVLRGGRQTRSPLADSGAIPLTSSTSSPPLLKGFQVFLSSRKRSPASLHIFGLVALKRVRSIGQARPFLSPLTGRFFFSTLILFVFPQVSACKLPGQGLRSPSPPQKGSYCRKSEF